MSDYVPLEKFQDFFQANRLVPKYNPSSERRIPHQYWELDSPKIDSLLKELSTLITGAIGKVPNGDLELSHVFRTGGSLRLIPRGPPMKFALVGAQGVGKSLLLNALFNRDGISLTGADGKACTNVMVRYAHYRGPQSDGKDQFVAEVEFFDDETLEKLIDEHAKAYYHVQHADEDSDDEESSRKRSHTQDEIDRRQKDTAEEIFCTLFGSKDNFLQAWSAETYHNGEFGQLCLIQCKTAMRSQNPSSKGIATFVSETPEDLLSQVKPLMAKTENRRSLWPLVKCVTIRFHDALLEQNIEILDLPG